MHIWDLVDALGCVINSFAIFFDHFRLHDLTISHSVKSGSLRNGRSGEDNVLIDLLYGLYYALRSDDIADSPSGHGIVFGETVYDDGSLLHTRKGSEGHEGVLITE